MGCGSSATRDAQNPQPKDAEKEKVESQPAVGRLLDAAAAKAAALADKADAKLKDMMQTDSDDDGGSNADGAVEGPNVKDAETSDPFFAKYLEAVARKATELADSADAKLREVQEERERERQRALESDPATRDMDPFFAKYLDAVAAKATSMADSVDKARHLKAEQDRQQAIAEGRDPDDPFFAKYLDALAKKATVLADTADAKLKRRFAGDTVPVGDDGAEAAEAAAQAAADRDAHEALEALADIEAEERDVRESIEDAFEGALVDLSLDMAMQAPYVADTAGDTAGGDAGETSAGAGAGGGAYEDCYQRIAALQAKEIEEALERQAAEAAAVAASDAAKAEQEHEAAERLAQQRAQLETERLALAAAVAAIAARDALLDDEEEARSVLVAGEAAHYWDMEVDAEDSAAAAVTAADARMIAEEAERQEALRMEDEARRFEEQQRQRQERERLEAEAAEIQRREAEAQRRRDEEQRRIASELQRVREAERLRLEERERLRAMQEAEARAAAAAARRDKISGRLKIGMGLGGQAGMPRPQAPSAASTPKPPEPIAAKKNDDAPVAAAAADDDDAAVIAAAEAECKASGYRARNRIDIERVRAFEDKQAELLASSGGAAHSTNKLNGLKDKDDDEAEQYTFDGPALPATGPKLRTQTPYFDGRLIVCVLSDQSRWYYNDDPRRQMSVTATLSNAKPSQYTAPDDGSVTVTSTGAKLALELAVFPGETKSFGRMPSGSMSFSFSSSSLGQEYKEKQKASATSSITAAQDAMAAVCRVDEITVPNVSDAATNDAAVKAPTHNDTFVDALKWKNARGIGSNTAQRGALLDSITFRDRRDAMAAAKCGAGKVTFVDPSFSPTDASAGQLPPAKRQGLGWMRPRDFLPPAAKSQRCLIGTVSPEDVVQGSLGDCYFVCSMAAIAEYPDLVHRCFPYERRAGETAADSDALDAAGTGAGGARQVLPSAAAASAGAKVVRLCNGGWWRDVVLDAYLPVGGTSLVFAKNEAEAHEMWVPYLEKAFAKIRGTYATIVGGSPRDALSVLTGAPCVSFNIDEDPSVSAQYKEELFRDLTLWNSADYCIAISMGGGSKKTEAEGLVANHAFTLLSTVCVPKDVKAAAQWALREKKRAERWRAGGTGAEIEPETSAPKGTELFRLLHIRNPWGGSREWTGDWSDKSALWRKYPHVAEAAKFSGPCDDGAFWMSIDDVVGRFDSGSVCCVHRRWTDYRVALPLHRKSTLTAIEVTLTHGTDITACLSVPRADGDIDTGAMLMMRVFKVTDEKAKGKGKGKGSKTIELFCTTSKTGASRIDSKSKREKTIVYNSGIPPTLRATFPVGQYLFVCDVNAQSAGPDGDVPAVLALQSLVPFNECGTAPRFVSLPKTSAAMKAAHGVSVVNGRGATSGHYDPDVAVVEPHRWQVRRREGALEEGHGTGWQ